MKVFISTTRNAVTYTKPVCGIAWCIMRSIVSFIHFLIEHLLPIHTHAETTKACTKPSIGFARLPIK